MVVGASVAGMTAVETLRRRGFNGTITLIGDEVHAPYDRPPLSKQVLTGSWEHDRLALREDDALNRLEIERRLGIRAAALDLEHRTVELENQDRVPYDGLIITTGVTPRHLPTGHHLAGVHVLRTIDDALALRTRLRVGSRLVVVGAGFLGCEVAAAARGAGVQVTIVDPHPAPMARQLGEDIGRRLADLHREQGVEIQCGSTVRGLRGDSTVTGVELATGDILPADLVLVAIGSTPATQWLEGSGLVLDDGVVCDATCRAAPGVYAAGDVARWWHPTLGRHIRVEHRMNATEQAVAAATNLLGAEQPFAPVPYFWTDQYEHRIQAYGTFPRGSFAEVIGGDIDKRQFIARYVQDDRIAGVLAWNMPRELRAERAHIGKPAPVAEP
ncbi:FAD-dependent oxidoreductase [Streptomyces sp. NPDC001508]|uniref:NAD(P)/FAD-dependent oxidoreductase n=1 Tax=Streptomyces sp. NPDC001508 TaxID=3154656 RepID=UPI00331AF0BE